MNRFGLVCVFLAVMSGWTTVSEAQTSTTPRNTPQTPKEPVLDPEDAKLPLVSPYSAVARSAFVPGWGQFVIRQPIQGSFFLGTTAGLAAGWFIVHQEYRDKYALYEAAARNYGFNSEEANRLYVPANKDYKTSRALLFTMMGVWAYSLIDAYVDASIYNAELRSKRVLEEGEQIRKINIRWRGGPVLQWNGRF